MMWGHAGNSIKLIKFLPGFLRIWLEIERSLREALNLFVVLRKECSAFMENFSPPLLSMTYPHSLDSQTGVQTGNLLLFFLTPLLNLCIQSPKLSSFPSKSLLYHRPLLSIPNACHLSSPTLIFLPLNIGRWKGLVLVRIQHVKG